MLLRRRLLLLLLLMVVVRRVLFRVIASSAAMRRGRLVVLQGVGRPVVRLRMLSMARGVIWVVLVRSRSCGHGRGLEHWLSPVGS